jgi:hypothetical protein
MARANSSSKQHPEHPGNFKIRPPIAETVRNNAGAGCKEKTKSKASIKWIFPLLEETVSQRKHLLEHKQNDYESDDTGFYQDLDVVVRIFEIILCCVN